MCFDSAACPGGKADRIREKMDEAGIRNMSAYVRKMALDGICVKLDLEDVRELSVLLRRCSNNLNQYAKRANETGSIYAADIADLQAGWMRFGNCPGSRFCGLPASAEKGVVFPPPT